jgi:hypothetical protein
MRNKSKRGKILRKIKRNNGILIIFIFLILSCKQKSEEVFTEQIPRINKKNCAYENLFLNETFKFDIIFTSSDKVSSEYRLPKGFEFKIDNKYIECFLKITKNDLIKMFKSEETDFAIYIMTCKVYYNNYFPGGISLKDDEKQIIISWRRSINKPYLIAKWKKEGWWQNVPD